MLNHEFFAVVSKDGKYLSSMRRDPQSAIDAFLKQRRERRELDDWERLQAERGYRLLTLWMTPTWRLENGEWQSVTPEEYPIETKGATENG
jgi:hypothetical protein